MNDYTAPHMYCNLLDEMTRSVQLQKSETPAASMRVKRLTRSDMGLEQSGGASVGWVNGESFTLEVECLKSHKFRPEHHEVRCFLCSAC